MQTVLVLEEAMKKNKSMVCWKGERFWLGRLIDHPEIMSQGRTLKELQRNLREAYRMMRAPG